jgi:YHS domain-containing protein
MPTEKVTDPVCKMEISKNEAMATLDYQGKRYYFCAKGCKVLFDQDPEKYITSLDKRNEQY